MRTDDRSFDQSPVPERFLDLSKRYEAIIWLERRLSRLDRHGSCKQIMSLKSELTSLLNDDNSSTYDDIHKSLVSREQSLHQKEAEITRLKTELEKRPIREIEKVVYRDKSESEADLVRSPSAWDPRIPWFWLIIGGLIILLIMSYHNS